jgi:serine protease
VPQQHALSQVDAFAAWEYGTGSANTVTIAMVDTGIDGSQPDLRPKLLSAGAIKSQFFDPDAGGAQAANDPPTAACRHATRTASVAAAATNNGVGIAGMSWGAQLLSLKVFNDADCNSDCSDQSLSGCGTTDSAMANAISYATGLQDNAAVGKVVVNVSIGGPGGCPGTCPGVNCMALTQAALAAAVTAGIPVTIAAGNVPLCTNGGTSGITAPADCAGTGGGSGIIPVGAVDSLDRIASFSCTGPELAANGLVAPGSAVLVDDVGGGTALDSGTSFAAPYVAGLAALILSAKPTLTPAQVQANIRGGADSIGVAGARPAGNTTGAGRMDAFRSMRLTVKGTLADFAGDQTAIAFPNPFRLSQTGAVSFSVPTSLQGANAAIKIYTIAGEFVRTLTGLTWDGKNSGGNPVATGTYVFVVSTDNGTARGRMAVIR